MVSSSRYSDMLILGQGFRKFEPEQDRQTDRMTDTHTHTHRRDRTYYHAALAGGIFIIIASTWRLVASRIASVANFAADRNGYK